MRSVVSRTFLSFALVLAIGQILIASESGANDWPRWRGKNMDGKAIQKGVFKFDQGYGLKITWKKSLGGGYSSISIVDDHAVTMYSDSTNDYLVSLDTKTGNENWRYEIDATYDAPPNSNDGPLSTPVIDDGKVFALGPKGHLVAIDLKSGKELWKHHIVTEYSAMQPRFGFTTAPHVTGDVLVVETGGSKNTISGFDTDSGKLLWATGTDTVNYQSPLSVKMFGENHLLCVGDKYVFGLNPKSGDMLWEYHHNGGNGWINPLRVDENKFLLNHNFRESVLIELSKENKNYAVKELWKTKNLKRSFSNSIYHDGYIYGYDARFLICVDAETGEKVWKSRPPGDGFLIMVDNHLVVITKRGTLHVSKASPEGYNELASLQIFDNPTWTPASFANGKIFVRNFHEVAAIDIAKVDQLTLDRPGSEILNTNGDFAKFVKSVNAASAGEKKALVDKFMKSQKSFPVIEDKKYAHIVYHGEASDIAIGGDMLTPGQQVPLNRIKDTDFFFASYELEPDARITYQIIKDFDDAISDPLNQYHCPTGPGMRGGGSDLRMPNYKPVTHFEEPKAGVARGTIETIELESKILKNKRNLHVYLPAEYTGGNTRYPVLYVNYGKGAKDQMLMPNSLDNLIAAKEISPVIAVFVEQPPRAGQEYSRNLRDQHAQMFAEELVPHIDQKYRTKTDADSRVLTGGDEGGFAAFYAAFKYPDVFHNVAGQSTHLLKPAGGDALAKIVRESGKLPIDIYMDWGKYDLIYQSHQGDRSWPQLNKEFVKLLQEKGYSVEGGQVNDGFGWASWRNRTDLILETFFSTKQTMK